MKRSWIRRGIVIIGILLVLWTVPKVLAYYSSRVPDLKIKTLETGGLDTVQLNVWFEKLQELGKFNGAVLIAKDSKALFKGAYGFTDYTQREHLKTSSSFRLASLSKQFTAFGIMLLKEKGQLQFDDHVSLYIPDFPYNGVTIRQLLTMTSGIPDGYLTLAETHRSEIGDILSIQKAVKLISKYPSKAATPNSWFNYSNTNYILLAGIIENTSGLSFEKFMQQEVFTPLGMGHTRVWNLLSAEKTFSGKTTVFFKENQGLVPAVPPFIDGVAGDGGIFSSVEDFLIWDKALYENSLISDKTLKEAFESITLIDGSDSNYGFGWNLGEHSMQHSGGWLAAHTFIYRDTKHKVCLVLLDNFNNSKHLPAIREELLELLQDDLGR